MEIRVKGRWFYVYKSGMWWIAEDDGGFVWGMSSTGPLHACNEARQRKAAGASAVIDDHNFTEKKFRSRTNP